MNCDCIKKMDERLKEKNLRLCGYALTFPDFKAVPTMNTEWIDPDKAPKGQKNKPTKIFASYCPFCGKAIKIAFQPPYKGDAKC